MNCEIYIRNIEWQAKTILLFQFRKTCITIPIIQDGEQSFDLFVCLKLCNKMDLNSFILQEYQIICIK